MKHPVSYTQVENSSQKNKENGVKILRTWSSSEIFPWLSQFLTMSNEVDFVDGSILPNFNKNWASHRGSLLANTQWDGSYTRPLLTAISYNYLASIVNCISMTRVLDFSTIFNFYPTFNGVCGYNKTVRPRDQYRTFNGTTDPLYALAQKLGIPIKTIADLPPSYANLSTVNYDCKILIDTTTNYASASFNSLEKTQNGTVSDVMGWDAPVSSYYWCAISDVKKMAELLGFHFTHSQTAVPLRLETRNLDSATISVALSSDYPPGSGGDPLTVYFKYNAPSGLSDLILKYAYAQFVNDVSGEWVKDLDVNKLRSDEYAPPGTSRGNLNGFRFVTTIDLNLDDDFLRRNWDGLYPTRNSFDPDKDLEFILWRDFSSTPVKSTVFFHPAPWLNYIQGDYLFQVFNNTNPQQSVSTPPNSIPATFNSQVGDVTTTVFSKNGDTPITAIGTSSNVMFFIEEKIDISY